MPQSGSRAASTAGSQNSAGLGRRQWNSHFVKAKNVAVKPPVLAPPPRPQQTYKERLQQVAPRNGERHYSTSGAQNGTWELPCLPVGLPHMSGFGGVAQQYAATWPVSPAQAAQHVGWQQPGIIQPWPYPMQQPGQPFMS